MDNYWLLLLLPLAWFAGTLLFHIGSLFFLWIKFKLQNLKELRIWD